MNYIRMYRYGKETVMQAFIERIDIFSERRENGNWIRNIKFQFLVPILRDGKEVVRVDGIFWIKSNWMSILLPWKSFRHLRRLSF